MAGNSQDINLKKEKILRWRLQQQQQTQPRRSEETTEASAAVAQPETKIDPLDEFMSSLHDSSDHKAAVDFVERDDQEFEDDSFLRNEASDVIATAVKKIKTLDSIPLTPIPESLTLESVRKNFYAESPEIQAMSESQVAGLRKELDNIRVRAASCPKPVRRWEQLGLSLRILEILRRNRFEGPTPIQAQGIPAALSGRDLLGIAKTGSGKTLAYILPLIRHVSDQRLVRQGEGPVALVLTPTRELALQIYSECRKLTHGSRIRVSACYGGPPIKDQISVLRRGTEIVVSTPGRWIDLLCANVGKVTNLHRVTFLVLDEADRMFDAGFEPQIMRIVQCSRDDRQTLLFSATFPRSVEALARRILQQPIEIVVGERSVVCADVQQNVEVIEEESRFPRLLQLCGTLFGGRDSQQARMLIFVERQEDADHLLRNLIRRSYPCQSLHGGRDQADRDATIADFRSGVTSILIATSVAARGLDVPGIEMVVNYDCPNHMEDYVHRVGRTGRAGRSGIAFTFITPEQDRYAADIVKALRASKASVPEELERLSEAYQKRVRRGVSDSSTAAIGAAGFGGKGLTKLDKDREALKDAQKAAFREQQSETDHSEDSSSLLPTRMKDSASSGCSVTSKRLAQVVEAIHQRLLALGLALERVDPIVEINERLGFAVGDSREAEIVPIPEGTTAALAPSGNRMVFCCEVEINDFPQHTRWRVTSRDALNSVTLATGTAITVRGTFVPLGPASAMAAASQSGDRKRGGASLERKLYLYVEGETVAAVERARSEIKRILTETLMVESASA